MMLNNAAYNANDDHEDMVAIKVFGFWVYLMSDCILFSILFATYAVLSNNVADGPTGKDIFKLPFILIETFFLLLSSVTSGMATIAMYRNYKSKVNIWLGFTFLFGLNFIIMEIYELCCLIDRGYGPDRSAFLSSLFTLVGTHGLHVISGLVWIMVMIIQFSYRGITLVNKMRLKCLSLFWHFLDVVWICVFTIVYLLGSIK